MTLITPTALHDAQGNLKALVECEPDTPVLRKPCGALHYSPNFYGNLMVVTREDLLEDGTCMSVRLSADGLGWTSEWHQGPESGHGAVYVERHAAADGRVFHGWVDKQSRRIVQAG